MRANVQIIRTLMLSEFKWTRRLGNLCVLVSLASIVASIIALTSHQNTVTMVVLIAYIVVTTLSNIQYLLLLLLLTLIPVIIVIFCICVCCCKGQEGKYVNVETKEAG